jgi:hypothetical protein
MRHSITTSGALALVLLGACNDSATLSGAGDDGGDEVQMFPPELACAVFESAVVTAQPGADTSLPIRIQRCAYEVEQAPGEPPTAVIVHAEGKETTTQTMVGDKLVEDRIPFRLTIRANLGSSDETTYSIRPDAEPGFANVDIDGTAVEGEVTVETFAINEPTLSVDLDLSTPDGKTVQGRFVARLAEQRQELACHPDNPDSKTLAHGAMCLGRDQACSDTSLPCCTDECQAKDGSVHDSETPLRCAAGGTCVPSEGNGLPAYCPMAAMPAGGASCAGGTLYCGANWGCCPPATPYVCPTTGECFELEEDADYACEGSDNICIECRLVEETTIPGGADCPCGSFSSSISTACAPDPLAPACYCENARMNKCLADNAAGCMADEAAARAEVQRLVMSAIEEGGSCSL